MSSRRFGYSVATEDASITRLTSITELGGRTLGLRYRNFDPAKACPALAPGSRFETPPPYALCQVDYGNPGEAVTTTLRYFGGQLAQIEDPGALPTPATPTEDGAAGAPVLTDFYYLDGLLSRHRSPLVHDAVEAVTVPEVPDDDRTKTVIVHSGAKVASVSLPVPNAGDVPEALRPGHTYTYSSSASTTTVRVDGLAGVNRSVAFDARGRTTTDIDATGLTTTLVWDGADNLVSVTDTAKRRTVTTYDGDTLEGGLRLHSSGRPTQVYGPAPESCFAEGGPPCPANTPLVKTAYDTDTAAATGGSTPWTGLAATYWATRALTGTATDRRPKAHDLVALSSGSPLGPLPPGLTANNWSARYTGEIAVTAAGAHGFALNLTGGGQLFVDDKLVVDASGNRSTAALVSSPTTPTLLAGRHRIRLDYEAPTSGTAALELWWSPPESASAPVPAASVAPRYSLPTATTVEDWPSATPRVGAVAYLAPTARALVATSTAGVGTDNLALSTETTYTATGLLRPTATYRPGAGPGSAASGTDYGWWGETETSPTGVCPASGGVNQAGALKSLTLPASAGGARRAESYVYDWAGRVVEATVAGSTTCTIYDSRGRPLTVAYPAHTNTNVTPPMTELARTVTYDYAVGGSSTLRNDGDPRVSSVTDAQGAIITRWTFWAAWCATVTCGARPPGTPTTGPVG